MSWIRTLVARAFGGRRQPARRTTKETVICLGCDEGGTILDSVLAPGAYEVSFVSSMKRAYSIIAAAMPDRVVLYMRADDEESLRVLSMLTLDPRTNHIPVMTYVANVPAEACDGAVDDDSACGTAPARHGVVMH